MQHELECHLLSIPQAYKGHVMRTWTQHVLLPARALEGVVEVSG